MLIVWTGAQAQPLRKIRIGYPSISSRQAQLWVAKDEGIFRKHGLDVELIFLRGGQIAIQALTGGDPPLVTIGNVIIANCRGTTSCSSARWKTPTTRAFSLAREP